MAVSNIKARIPGELHNVWILFWTLRITLPGEVT